MEGKLVALISIIANFILLFIVTIYIKKYKNYKIRRKMLWYASVETIDELLKSKRIDAQIDGDLKDVKTQNDLILLYERNIDSFKTKMGNLAKISLRKRNVPLSDVEWKLVFFSVLLNQSYKYGSTSAYIHLTKERIVQNLSHIISLDCGNYGIALYCILANINEDFNLRIISYDNHCLAYYENKDEGLLLDPTYNIYGFVSKSELNNPSFTKMTDSITNFIFLENKNNTNSGLTFHDNMNKFQATILCYIGGDKMLGISKVREIEGRPSNQKVYSLYSKKYTSFNDEYIRKINY